MIEHQRDAGSHDVEINITLGVADGWPYLLLADGDVLVPLSDIEANCGPVAQASLARWIERILGSLEVDDGK